MNNKYSIIKIDDSAKESLIRFQGYLQYKTGKYISQGRVAALSCLFWLKFEKFDIEDKVLDLIIENLKEEKISEDLNMMMSYLEDKKKSKRNKINDRKK